MENIKNALESINNEYEIKDNGILVKGKLAGVKTKINKGLGDYRIAKDNNGYFGEYIFKHRVYKSTFGGFDMIEKQIDGKNFTFIYQRGGVGFNGQD